MSQNPTYAPLTWDEDGTRQFENGISHVVLYVWNDTTNNYGTGVAWNGITGITENREGAEGNAIWADNIKYGVLRGPETLGLSITAYTYPDEWGVCDGSATVSGATGLSLGQQKRKKFALCYRTEVGNDSDQNAGYKLHLVYGCTASPSERSFETINDSPDAIEFSWDVDTTPTPVPIDGYEPVSSLEIDSILAGDTIKDIEAIVYGSTTANASMPSVATVITTLGGTIPS